MSSIKKLFDESSLASIKHEKYFTTYSELLSPYKNKDITFVEIGVHNGGSLEIWKKLFGANSTIIGIDNNPDCKKFEEFGVKIEIGNQADPLFWKSFFNKYNQVDIILDDGGHTNAQQNHPRTFVL